MCAPPIDFGTLKDLNDEMETEDDMDGNIPNECPRCSQELMDGMKECPECGMEFGRHEEKNKDFKIAILASLLFPGLGQFYNDKMGKSIFFFILGAISLLYIYSYIVGWLVFFPMIFIIIFWAYNIYDAFSTARKMS